MTDIPDAPAARRLAILNRCLEDGKTLEDAYATAWDIECFIELGVDADGIEPEGKTKVSREKARDEVLRMTLEGMTPKAIKNSLGISKDAVYRHIFALRKEGKLPAKGNGLAESKTGLEVVGD